MGNLCDFNMCEIVSKFKGKKKQTIHVKLNFMRKKAKLTELLSWRTKKREKI